MLNPIAQHHVDDDLSLDDESFKRELESVEDIIPEKDESLIPKLKSNIGKAIIKTVTGEGYNKIKIDQDLLH